MLITITHGDRRSTEILTVTTDNGEVDVMPGAATEFELDTEAATFKLSTRQRPTYPEGYHPDQNSPSE